MKFYIIALLSVLSVSCSGAPATPFGDPLITSDTPLTSSTQTPTEIPESGVLLGVVVLTGFILLNRKAT